MSPNMITAVFVVIALIIIAIDIATTPDYEEGRPSKGRPIP